MSTQNNGGLAAVHAAALSGASAAALSAAADSTAAAPAAKPDNAAAEPARSSPSVADDRARSKQILGSDAAKGREELAHYFAFETDMTAAAAIAALEKAPKAVASRLDEAMKNFQPKVDAAEGDTAAGAVKLSAGLGAAVARQLAKIGKKPKLAAH